jgi:tetratricopeptide (TPR) repeat protein
LTLRDVRGNPVSSSAPAALAAAEQALWRMMSFFDTPLADLDLASQNDPGWMLPHVMRAGFLLSLTESPMVAAAQEALQQAKGLAAHAAARERAHLAAVQQVAEGRWHAACRTWDELLVEHPRDALALQWAQLWDFYRGDMAGLRGRAARALPQWAADDALYPYVLALHAFGLEESNLYPQAEETGRRALELNPRVPWAIHAVAHVMEMQGRFEEGSLWLRQRKAHWAEGNGFAGHLWWHKGLFRLEALDTEGALRLYDTRISGEALQITLQRVDAAALLWRLHLLGVDVHARAQALVAQWRPAVNEAGYYAFNDVHWLLALLCAGEVPAAEQWLARGAERAMASAEAARSNHAMAREVGLPLMRALLAFAKGRPAEAAAALYTVRTQAQRFGGSHAQRDVIDQTLLAAASAGGAHALGQAVVNERLMAKPATPLTRHWQQALARSG